MNCSLFPLRSLARKMALLSFGLTVFGIAQLTAATYYVATDGSDTNTGTEDAPFASLAKAQSVAASGDTVLIRGGTYSLFTIAATDSNYHYVHVLNKAGITYEAYPGEVPVFNFAGIPTDRRVCGFRITTTVTLIGIQVTGTPVGTQKQSENFRIDGSGANATFIDCVCHDTQANGFYFTNHGHGSCTNCDSYNNVGVAGTSIGNTDGFGAHGRSVVFAYCRSWHNSDDGYDCISSDQGASHTFDHCWAYDMRAGGDSNGFKVGGYGSGTVPATVPVHTVRYCLSANNNAHGFYANHQPGQAAVWTHNTSFNNAAGDFDMLERVSVTDPTDIPGYREVLHYNLGYLRQITRDDNDPPDQETSNSWTLPVTVDASDFQSVDPSQMTAPRKADGSLPDITFMHLVPGSDLTGLGCFDGPPAAPVGLSAAAASDTSVTLTWTAPDGATAYDVKRSTTPGGPYATVATGITDASYTDSGLTYGTTYYYVVAAVRGYSEEGPNSNEASATADKTPPVISGLSNQTIEATGPDGAVATYSATAVDAVSGPATVTFSVPSGSTFPLGSTTVTASATDAFGNTASVDFTITVVDTTPPTINSVTVSQPVLWPANHQMVSESVPVNATDSVSATVVSRIVSVTSNQAVNASGDGNTGTDWVITGPLTVDLRAERSGKGGDRVYTITVESRDSAGNVSNGTVTVTVPHNA